MHRETANRISNSLNQCCYFTLQYEKVAIVLQYNAKTDNMEEYVYTQSAWLFLSSTFATKITKSTITKVRDGAQNISHRPWHTLIGDDATDECLPQWRRDPTWLIPFSVAVSVRSDQWYVFYTLSCSIPTSCNQLIIQNCEHGGHSCLKINFEVFFL